jgi:hypothetical protein
MSLGTWSKSELEYGRKVLDSGLDGARSGREAFLDGRPLNVFLSNSAEDALTPAALGACIGVLGSFAGNRRSIRSAFAFGLLGGAIGFGAGVAWASRRLTGSVAHGALRNIGKVRDEHWFETHPIDYA